MVKKTPSMTVHGHQRLKQRVKASNRTLTLVRERGKEIDAYTGEFRFYLEDRRRKTKHKIVVYVNHIYLFAKNGKLITVLEVDNKFYNKTNDYLIKKPKKEKKLTKDEILEKPINKAKHVYLVLLIDSKLLLINEEEIYFPGKLIPLNEEAMDSVKRLGYELLQIKVAPIEIIHKNEDNENVYYYILSEWIDGSFSLGDEVDLYKLSKIKKNDKDFHKDILAVIKKL